MSKNFKKEYGKAQKYLVKHPKIFGMGLIVAFFLAFVMSKEIPGILPIFVLCTISIILSSAAFFVDYAFLNSIVIGYWAIYFIAIADVIFMITWGLIHVINLSLATYILIKRWKNTWPFLIFLSGLLWSAIIGTQKIVTHGESEYFRVFEWPVMGLFIMFDAFLATVIYLAQNPKKLNKRRS